LTLLVVEHLCNACLTFLSVLMATFPGEPWLSGFRGAKDDGSGYQNIIDVSTNATVINY